MSSFVWPIPILAIWIAHVQITSSSALVRPRQVWLRALLTDEGGLVTEFIMESRLGNPIRGSSFSYGELTKVHSPQGIVDVFLLPVFELWHLYGKKLR